MKFRTVKNKPVNPVNYTANIISANPYVELHIGTDSQRYNGKVTYVTAIAYRYPAKGVHYIYSKQIVPPIKDNWTRLFKETEYSIEVAELIANHMPGVRLELDMDYNEDEYYESSRLVSAARGWASSLGYKVNIKPHKQIATRAADYHCK